MEKDLELELELELWSVLLSRSSLVHVSFLHLLYFFFVYITSQINGLLHEFIHEQHINLDLGFHLQVGTNWMELTG